MIHKIKISIPEPCHENWSEMTPTEKGKFCNNCQKNVVDFTKASDREILLEYNKNENLCGRFRTSQLDRALIIPKEKKSIWMIAAASVIAFLGLGNQTAKAQGKPRIEQTDNKKLSDSTTVTTSHKNRYSGIVLDQQNNPLPGASVIINGTKIRTQTDIDGKFLIEAKNGAVLKILYVGYKNAEIKLQKDLNLSIKMKIDEVELQGFVITKEEN